MKRLALVACGCLLALAAAPAAAIESDPLPLPAAAPAARALQTYNEGVALLVARRFADAQARFEAALALDERLAEAHNNLAYALRMQGKHNVGPALVHYNRAIALKPGLAQAYAYRGMLFVQQRDLESARKDLQQLRRLDPKLAEGLARAIDKGDAVEERDGIAAQYE